MIGSDDIEKLAKLARIEITKEEKNSLAKEVDSILAYVGQVQSLGGGEEINEAQSIHNVLRLDDSPHESGLYTNDILKEAPAKEGGYIKVKKIL